MAGATHVLAEFIAGTRPGDLPSEVVAAAKIAILDGLGNVLAGSAQPVAAIVARYVREQGGAPDCGVVGWGFRTSPPQAAFANGVALHCLDFEVQGAPPSHGTSAILPPALALGEQQRRTGEAIVTAYALGWDVQARLRTATPRRRAFHPPGVFGPLAAAAASASLLGLSAGQVRTALGIAASRASGLTANTGTMVKATHPANAGRLGLEAALLARAGFTSHDAILETDDGYADALFGGDVDWDTLTRDLGRRFLVVDPGFNIKRYPAEIYLQWAIDAVVALRQEHDLRPDAVELLKLEVPAVQATLSRPRPRSGLDGKFSWEYCAAVALATGQVGIDAFTDEVRFSPAVEDALGKVRVVVQPDIPSELHRLWVGARARLRSGGEVHTICQAYRGSIANPMSRDERLAKFRTCASRVLADADVERVAQLAEQLDQLADVRELTDVLARASASPGEGGTSS